MDDKLIQELVRPVLDIAVKDMKRTGLDAEQAACALIINMTETFSKEGQLKAIEAENPDIFQSIFTVYCHYYNKMADDPKRYERAQALHDTDTFKKILAI